MKDSVEFYLGANPHPFVAVQASFQPNDGDLVNIKGQTYKVLGRSFCVDYSGTPNAVMRCVVIVEERRPARSRRLNQ